MSEFTLLEQFQCMLAVFPSGLLDFAKTIQAPDSCASLTEQEMVSLIETLEFMKFLPKLTSELERVVWRCQINLVRRGLLYVRYKDVFAGWCSEVLAQSKSPDDDQQFYMVLANFYMHTQNYDKCLKYYAKVGDGATFSDISLVVVYAKSSTPDVTKIVDLLKMVSKKDLSKHFVKRLITTHCQLVMSVLTELYKADSVPLAIKDYIDLVFLKYSFSLEQIHFIVHSGYFSRKVFIRLGLILCNPVNKASEIDARYVLNKLHSIEHVPEFRTIDVCESLLVGNVDNIVEFIDTAEFLNLTPQQRANIYLGVYTHLQNIDIDQAILFLIQALVVHDGLSGQSKTNYTVDVIKYFARSDKGRHTYRFYLREYVNLSKTYPHVPGMIEVLGVCLSTRDYDLADVLDEIIFDNMKSEYQLDLVKALQRSDRFEDLEQAMKYIMVMTQSTTSHMPDVYFLMTDIRSRLDNVSSSSSSKKRASPACARPEQSAEKHARTLSSNTCKVCREEFTDINSHEKTAKHLEKIGLFCFDCDRLFKSKTTLESHLLSCKGDQDILNYCQPCQRNFSSAQMFKIHRNVKGH